MAKRFPSLSRLPNQSHKIKAFGHTSTHIIVGYNAHPHTKNERGQAKHTQSCDIPFCTSRITRVGIMVEISCRGGREMSWKEVLSATLQIIRIQWWVLIGSAFLAWHDSTYLHNWIYIACWRTHRLKICLSTLIVNNTPTKQSRKNQFT